MSDKPMNSFDIERECITLRERLRVIQSNRIEYCKMTNKEFARMLKRVRKQHASTRAKARKFLREEGVLTASGKLTKRYGGR